MVCNGAMTDASEQTKALWVEYAETTDPDIRETLILKYVPLVRYVASRVGAGAPSHVEHQDLVQYGIFGLINAIDRFDLAHGVKFETYAVTRIRGAIIDELRTLDWVPRSVRSQTRQLDRAKEALQTELSRLPTDEEIADRLEVAVEQVWMMRAEASASGSLTSLQELHSYVDAGGSDDFEVEPADMTVDDPVLQVELGRTMTLVAEAISMLPDNERTVAALYYRENMKLAEIGTLLGVTQTRVCSVYTSAAQLIRHRLAAVG